MGVEIVTIIAHRVIGEGVYIDLLHAEHLIVTHKVSNLCR